MIKIAFLFLTIANIIHEPIWHDFFKGHDSHYSIYIHAKEEFDNTSVFKQYEMPTKVPTTWENTMEAQIEMLREALKDPLNEKFIFLSGDSLPIQHFDYVYQQIMQHPLSIFNYSWNNHQDADSSFYYAGRILKGIPSDKQHKNSQWIILNRKHAIMMVEDKEFITTITQYPCDNEHYPSTFLAMHGLLHEVANQPTMLTIWNRGYDHPFTFKSVEDRYQAELLTEAMNQSILFARKFDKKIKQDQLVTLIEKYARPAEVH
jgi:hypothetical protein